MPGTFFTLNLVPSANQISLSPFTTYQYQNMLATRTTDHPTGCDPPPRLIKKVPPFIDTIIVHDASITTVKSYNYYPNLAEIAKMSPCDQEGLHYQLRSKDVDNTVPYYLELVQSGWQHELKIHPPNNPFTLLPLTIKLSIALVDIFGD